MLLQVCECTLNAHRPEQVWKDIHLEVSNFLLFASLYFQRIKILGFLLVSGWNVQFPEHPLGSEHVCTSGSALVSKGWGRTPGSRLLQETFPGGSVRASEASVDDRVNMPSFSQVQKFRISLQVKQSQARVGACGNPAVGIGAGSSVAGPAASGGGPSSDWSRGGGPRARAGLGAHAQRGGGVRAGLRPASRAAAAGAAASVEGSRLVHRRVGLRGPGREGQHLRPGPQPATSQPGGGAAAAGLRRATRRDSGAAGAGGREAPGRWVGPGGRRRGRRGGRGRGLTAGAGARPGPCWAGRGRRPRFSWKLHCLAVPAVHLRWRLLRTIRARPTPSPVKTRPPRQGAGCRAGAGPRDADAAPARCGSRAGSPGF